MICRVCKENREQEFFEVRTDTNKYRTECKVCRAKSRGHNSQLLVQKERDLLFSQGKKRCSMCENILSIYKFSKDKNTKTGYCSRCKNCIKQIQFNNKGSIKNYRLNKLYNIDLSLYQKMVENQDNKCKICGEEFSFEKKSKMIHVDHCHKTGKVRGLLCHYCNNILGNAKDNVRILEKAIKYLIPMEL